MTEKKIDRLIERFLDGDTTPSEEQSIYGYFAANTDAGELEKYRPMFIWYASLPRTATRRRWFSRPVAAAAGIALLIALISVAALAIISPINQRNELYARYEGSYVIENGVRITDISKIYDRLIEAEALADSLGRIDPEQEHREFEQSIINNVISSIDDPEIAAQIRADISENL